ncbi:hypothetical protein BJX70DRAFT_379677 [Aspergillus crustosus]
MTVILGELFLNQNYYAVAYAIMTHSTASAMAALFAALRGKLSPAINAIKDKFLQPLRDVDHTMELFEPWIRDELQILIIGPGSQHLRDRIKRPSEYYAQNAGLAEKLDVWIVAIPHANVGKLQRIRRKLIKRRGNSIIKLEQLIDKAVISQCADRMSGQIDFTSETVSGDNIRVKRFDLLSKHSDIFDRYSICFQFRGLKCFLPWDLRNTQSRQPCWRPSDGIFYLNTADPFNLQTACMGLRRGAVKNDHEHDLVFTSWCPEWHPQYPIFLPISLTDKDQSFYQEPQRGTNRTVQ